MYIGLDIGGTKILGGLIDGKTIVNTHKVKTLAQATDMDIKNQIIEVIEVLSKGQALDGIGVGIPGSIDRESGTILFSPNLPLRNFPLKTYLTERFKVPVAIGNDVNVGMLGEHWVGAANKHKNVIGIFIGTGIGGAIILNNQLYHGKHHIAGEIGHMKLKLDGPLCGCGQHGCLEALASKIAIQKMLEKQGISFEAMIKSSYLKEQIKADNETVKLVVKKAATAIGEACGNLVNILDPEAIILGGGVIEAIGDYMLKRIKETATKRALVKPVIKISELGDNALLYGAVRLLQTMNG